MLLLYNPFVNIMLYVYIYVLAMYYTDNFNNELETVAFCQRMKIISIILYVNIVGSCFGKFCLHVRRLHYTL